jgi:hypothetical protein
MIKTINMKMKTKNEETSNKQLAFFDPKSCSLLQFGLGLGRGYV